MSHTFLNACAMQPTDHTPIWLMRQAGRYQPEYRALREKFSFVELCKRSDLAAEVTLLPVQQMDVDAAILFADILLILEPLGAPFHFTPDDGPRVNQPIRTAAQVDALATDGLRMGGGSAASGSARDGSADDGSAGVRGLDYVLETLRLTRAALPKEKALIGFAGAPFTLASYLIEGGGSKHYAHAKRFMWEDPSRWHALMERISDATITYLLAQLHAGADAVQLFDSWVGVLSEQDYRTFVFPHTQKIFAALPEGVPAIQFGTGNPLLYPAMFEAARRDKGTVMGFDWRVDLRQWADKFPSVAVQGNLDPVAILSGQGVMRAQATRILESMRGRPGHIFNLGHGIMPNMQVDDVRALVDHVHSFQ